MAKPKLFVRFRKLSIWNKLNTIIAIVTLFGCVISIGYPIYTYYNPKYIPVLNGVISPANEPNPYKGIDCRFPANTKILDIGNLLYAWGIDQIAFIISLDGRELIRINNTNQGLFIDATIYRPDGRLVAKIVNNSFTVNPNQFLKLESRDQHELNVVGRDGIQLFYIRYVNENAVVVQGIFSIPGKYTVTATKDYLNFAPTDTTFSGCTSDTTNRTFILIQGDGSRYPWAAYGITATPPH